MKRIGDLGFTLLELLMVVLVLALVLAVSYPSLSRGSSSIRLRATGRDVLNTLRFAREKAVTEQIGMRVTMDREKHNLILSDDLGDGRRTYSLPRDVRIQRITLGDEEVHEGPVSIRFLPNGGSDRIELLLRSDTGSILRIISDPITGGARIEQGAGENFK